ncbi:MAG TPA: T9SS type A sorting domain-containing protein, partial [Rhodothermales bacterium]|nr:T9SS type A sorting domain-containing protein [Rhodothermales bacterium]
WVTDPVTVSLEVNNEGNETDSTNFELFVTAKGDVFFTERFIYRIGPATRLVGAVVGDLSYGDTSLINSVALSIESKPAAQNAQAELDLYPNPFHRQAIIRFQPQQAGRYALSIYDVLGRHIRTMQKPLAASEIWNLTWSLDRPLPSSIYFIEVTRDGSILKRASLIHVQ